MFTWFIAKRLFRDNDNVKRVSRPAILVATMGVAIGVCVMIVSVCVLRGFQQEIRGKVIGLGGHIQVVNYETLYKTEASPIVVDDSLLNRLSRIPGVRHVQRFCAKPGMLKTEESFRGGMFRGVGKDYDTTFLHRHLVAGSLPAFSDTASAGQLLISSRLASQLHLEVGDRVYAYFFEQQIRARRFKVTGVFNTNMADMDNNLAFTDISTVQHLCGWDPLQYAGAEVVLERFDELAQVSGRVEDAVNHTHDAYGAYYSSPTISDLYPSVFSWLELLDTNVWVILILMVCVAGFTMISGLLIIILERTNFIGVMKAMGATNAQMRRVFLCFAAFIVGRGLLYGNLLAAVLIGAQMQFHVVSLDPQSYYMDTVPMSVHPGYLLLIDVCTLVVSMLALVVPSYLISHIHPARSIRFE